MQQGNRAKGVGFERSIVSNLRFNMVGAILLALLIFLQYRLWFEAGGIHDMLQLKKNLATQAKENEQLKKQNEELLFQIKRLQNSQDAVESRARNELGMIKKGEIFYQIVKGSTNENTDQ